MENTKESSANKQLIALITGANQGVGFQIAKALANNGYIVYIGSRNPENGTKAATEIGDNARAVELDVTKQATITATAAHIAQEHGYLDLLVNNAGISHAGKPGRTLQEVVEANRASKASLDEVRTVWETNVFGTIALRRPCCPC